MKKIIKKVIKKIGIVCLIILALIVLIVICSYINHKIKLKEEDAKIIQIGTLVEVNGHNINVYTEGNGEKTLVFMSGGGTCSPILDFKSVYSLLSDDYKIVVIEKFGYGFSDDYDTSRDIDTILSETRQALSISDISGPFILVPHSMSGLEAIYWAQQYPNEVEAIVGLDMAVPSVYENMKINIPLLHLVSFASKTGITRFISGIEDGDAVKYGTLSDKEKELYRAIFYRRTATKAMLNEAATVKSNAQIVNSGETIEAPVLLFVSDGSGGTGYEKETWKSFQQKFASELEYSNVIYLDVPHYVHNHEYKKIAEEIKLFIQETLK